MLHKLCPFKLFKLLEIYIHFIKYLQSLMFIVQFHLISLSMVIHYLWLLCLIEMILLITFATVRGLFMYTCYIFRNDSGFQPGCLCVSGLRNA